MGETGHPLYEVFLLPPRTTATGVLISRGLFSPLSRRLPYSLGTKIACRTEALERRRVKESKQLARKELWSRNETSRAFLAGIALCLAASVGLAEGKVPCSFFVLRCASIKDTMGGSSRRLSLVRRKPHRESLMNDVTIRQHRCEFLAPQYSNA